MAKTTRGRRPSKNTPAKSDTSSVDLGATPPPRSVGRPTRSRPLFENTLISNDASISTVEMSTPRPAGKRARGRPSLNKTLVGNRTTSQKQTLEKPSRTSVDGKTGAASPSRDVPTLTRTPPSVPTIRLDSPEPTNMSTKRRADASAFDIPTSPLRNGTAAGSELESSFLDSRKTSVSTVDSAHSYDILGVNDVEVSALIQDAAQDLIEVRMKEMSTEAEGKKPDIHAAGRSEESALLSPPVSPIANAPHPSVSADTSFGTSIYDTSLDDNQVNEPPPDVWTPDPICDDPTVPVLSPNATLLVVKRFLGTHQCTINFQSTLDCLSTLSRQPQWPTLTVHNLDLLISIVQPGYKLLSEEQLGQLRAEARTSVVPEGHQVVSPARMQHLVNLEMRSTPPLLPPSKFYSDQGRKKVQSNCKRPSKSEQWWKRFSDTTAEDLELPPGIAAMLQRSAVDNWASTHCPLINPVDLDGQDKGSVDLVTSRIMFMATSSQSNVQKILLNVFFCITSYHYDPKKWDQDYQTLLDVDDAVHASPRGDDDSNTRHGRFEQKKLPRMSKKDYELLWTKFHTQYPDFEITKDKFIDMIGVLRKRGSSYIFIASRLRLGSLLYLQARLTPETMWGASKGGDASGVSNRALRHLEDLGLVDMCQESGANSCVREMLSELLKGF